MPDIGIAVGIGRRWAGKGAARQGQAHHTHKDQPRCHKRLHETRRPNWQCRRQLQRPIQRRPPSLSRGGRSRSTSRRKWNSSAGRPRAEAANFPVPSTSPVRPPDGGNSACAGGGPAALDRALQFQEREGGAINRTPRAVFHLALSRAIAVARCGDGHTSWPHPTSRTHCGWRLALSRRASSTRPAS